MRRCNCFHYYQTGFVFNLSLKQGSTELWKRRRKEKLTHRFLFHCLHKRRTRQSHGWFTIHWHWSCTFFSASLCSIQWITHVSTFISNERCTADAYNRWRTLKWNGCFDLRAFHDDHEWHTMLLIDVRRLDESASAFCRSRLSHTHASLLWWFSDDKSVLQCYHEVDERWRTSTSTASTEQQLSDVPRKWSVRQPPSCTALVSLARTMGCIDHEECTPLASPPSDYH